MLAAGIRKITGLRQETAGLIGAGPHGWLADHIIKRRIRFQIIHLDDGGRLTGGEQCGTVIQQLNGIAASVLLQVILLAAVWGAGKVLKLNEVEATSIYYSNSGNLIVPLVTFILGKEWVLYGCVFMSVQLVFLWTHGKNTISREGKWDWKKIVFNVNMISVFAGVVLFFTKIRLPEIVDQALSSVGSMIGPASMIVTGMLIAEMNLRNIFENVKVYFISFLRLVVIPVISLAILKISGLVNIHPDGKKLLLIVFLAVITPSASTITQMCQVYGNDSKYASAINVMTTLLSIITMPLMVLLYQTMM